MPNCESLGSSSWRARWRGGEAGVPTQELAAIYLSLNARAWAFGDLGGGRPLGLGGHGESFARVIFRRTQVPARVAP